MSFEFRIYYRPKHFYIITKVEFVQVNNEITENEYQVDIANSIEEAYEKVSNLNTFNGVYPHYGVRVL